MYEGASRTIVVLKEAITEVVNEIPNDTLNAVFFSLILQVYNVKYMSI